MRTHHGDLVAHLKTEKKKEKCVSIFHFLDFCVFFGMQLLTAFVNHFSSLVCIFMGYTPAAAIEQKRI